jgi:hypothetical protein
VTLLDLEQYRVLEPVVDEIFEGIAEIESASRKTVFSVARRISGELAMKNRRLEDGSSVLNLGVGDRIVSWCRDIMADSPRGDIDYLTKDQVLRGLAWAASLPELAHQLYDILGTEQRLEYVSFRCYVEAGLALEQFAAVEPYLQTARVGIDVYYQKVCVQEQKIDEPCVPTIVGSIARALRLETATSV